MVLSNEKYKSPNLLLRYGLPLFFSGVSGLGLFSNKGYAGNVGPVRTQQDTTQQDTTQQDTTQQDTIPKGYYDIFIQDNDIVALFPQSIDTLDNTSKEGLESKIDSLNNLEGKFNILHIDGFASNEGDSLFNLELSNKRAKNIYDFVESNWDFGDFSFEGYGRTDRFREIENNRRVNIKYFIDLEGIEEDTTLSGRLKQFYEDLGYLKIKTDSSFSVDGLNLLGESKRLGDLTSILDSLDQRYSKYSEGGNKLFYSDFKSKFDQEVLGIRNSEKIKLDELNELERGSYNKKSKREYNKSFKKFERAVNRILDEKPKRENKLFKKLFRNTERESRSGYSAYGNGQEGGLDYIFDMRKREVGISLQVGLGVFNSTTTDDTLGNPMGRNNRSLYQKYKRREEGLITRVGGGILIGQLEAGVIYDLRKIRVIESVDEKVLNSDGSLYKPIDDNNPPKYGKKGLRNSGYLGFVVPVSKDFEFRGRVEFGKNNKPKYSVGFSRRIGGRG